MQNEVSIPGELAAELSVEDCIDLACDRFEQQFRAGNAPNLATFFDACDSRDRSRLFVELVLVDLELRGQGTEEAVWKEYVARFPEFAEQLEQARFLHHSASPAIRDADKPPPIVRRIAHFELLELIGKGAAGEVWRAKDPRLQRTVAIKIPWTYLSSDDDRNRFLREGRAAAQLSHPGIVPIFEVGRDGDTAYIVSAYIAGESLRDWLSKARPTPRESADLCRQLADALDHAHENGIVHRDLKPSNIIIDEAGQPHITDFGLAKWVNDGRVLTLDGELLGTPAYMSPEQARGQAARADRRTDVHSLGVILYEMLTGKCPFEGDPASLTYKIIHDEAVTPRSISQTIPHDLETICLKALEKSPERRYRTAQAMAVDLRRFLDGDAIPARRTSSPQRCLRWFRRRRALAVTIGLGLTSIAAIAVATWQHREVRSAMGYRVVSISTIPEGAKVGFAPYDTVTGEPQLEKAVYAPGVSPTSVELVPGDYLVVAVLTDDRFNEVTRKVPRENDALPGSFRHNRWTTNERREVVLPTVEIPDGSVTKGMVLLPGGPRFRVGSNESTASPSRDTEIQPFYIARREFTFGDYKSVFNGDLPKDLRTKPATDSHAVNVDNDRAAALAETSGGRLPTEAEFEFAATRGGSARFPWGDSPPPDTAEAAFGAVGDVPFDRLQTVPPVVGLASNVAEWTSSRPGPTQHMLPAELSSEYRVVKGGDRETVHGNARISTAARDPRNRTAVSRFSVSPGVGFRVVRSARPRLPMVPPRQSE